MKPELIRQYEGLVRNLEEPIREIVPATWQLPYVLDTNETCSGHILSQAGQGIANYPPSRRYSWYPHRATLEFAFSDDPELTEARDSFRNDLKAVAVAQDGLTLGFGDIWTYKANCLPSSKIPHPNLNEKYNAEVPGVEELEKSEDTVIRVESLLTSFWEEIAAVVRSHNSNAKIGPIGGKNFRRVINWANWRSFAKIKD